MCNNVLIEGVETYKRTCNNIDANEVNIRFICGGGKLKDNQININPLIKQNDEAEVRGVALDPNQVQVSVIR